MGHGTKFLCLEEFGRFRKKNNPRVADFGCVSVQFQRCDVPLGVIVIACCQQAQYCHCVTTVSSTREQQSLLAKQ